MCALAHRVLIVVQTVMRKQSSAVPRVLMQVTENNFIYEALIRTIDCDRRG